MQKGLQKGMRPPHRVVQALPLMLGLRWTQIAYQFSSKCEITATVHKTVVIIRIGSRPGYFECRHAEGHLVGFHVRIENKRPHPSDPRKVLMGFSMLLMPVSYDQSLGHIQYFVSVHYLFFRVVESADSVGKDTEPYCLTGHEDGRLFWRTAHLLGLRFPVILP